MTKDRFIELCSRSTVVPFLPGRDFFVELVGSWKPLETKAVTIYRPRVDENNEDLVKAKVKVERSKYQSWLDAFLLQQRKERHDKTYGTS